MSGVFGTRPTHGLSRALVHDELKRPRQRRFDGGAVDLAVALRRMGIAGEELRTIMKYRQEERRPDGQLVEIHIAAPAPGRARADHP